MPLRSPGGRPRRSSPSTEVGYSSPQDEASWWSVNVEETPELQWPLSIEVFDRMRRQDAQVQSVLRAVTLPVRQTEWRLDPAGARDEVVQFVADDLGLRIKGQDDDTPPARTRDRFSWSEHLQNALLMTVFGHMYFEQVYRPLGADGFMHLRKLAPRWPRTISKINVAMDGGLKSIEQHPPAGLIAVDGKGPILDVTRLVAYVLDREGANWLGTSLLRAAYKHWLIKDRLLRTWAQTIDRNGMGLPVYTGGDPNLVTVPPDDLDKGEGVAKSVRSGDNSGAGIPFSAKLELLGVKGTLPDAEKAVRYHDEQIGRSVLAHFLNLNAQGGSYALASVQAGTFFGSLNSLAQTFADTTTQHVVEDMVDLNFGVDEPAPRVVFEPIGRDSAAVVAAVKDLLATGALKASPGLDSWLRDLLGLPAKDYVIPQPNPASGGDQ
ncbi:hypothetical protein E4P38_02875 [Blastococcus sp. CT_GayMR16]|nr:hypothetical protein E4P38_02875 [Blastococcus sp. CT_GayMR16]